MPKTIERQFQGREITTTIQAPTSKALDGMIKGMRSYARKQNLGEVEVIQRRRDPDGGYEAIIRAHNWNPLSWIREKAEVLTPSGRRRRREYKEEEELLEEESDEDEDEDEDKDEKEIYGRVAEKEAIGESEKAAEEKSERERKKREKTEKEEDKIEAQRRKTELAKLKARERLSKKEARKDRGKVGEKIVKAMVPKKVPKGWYVPKAQPKLYSTAPMPVELGALRKGMSLEALKKAGMFGGQISSPQGDISGLRMGFGMSREVVLIPGLTKAESHAFQEIRQNGDVDSTAHVVSELMELGISKSEAIKAISGLLAKRLVEKVQDKNFPGEPVLQITEGKR